MTENTIRYDRQERIENWQQEKLAGAKVAIVGTGQLAQFTAASIAALGVGEIEIYKPSAETPDGFLTRLDSDGEDLEGILRKMNPEVKIRAISLGEEYSAREITRGKDLVLDLTNSRDSKERILESANETATRIFSASTGKTGGEMYFVNSGENNHSANLSSYDGARQGAFPSEIFGGMITEEVRKALMPLREGELPAKNIAYQATAERRFSKEGDFDAEPYEDLKEKRVLIVGAGALGNFVALGAALEGVGKIDILDFDEVEAHNLNRQVMFYDSVGKIKSTALAEKIKVINPDAEIRGLVGKLDENSTYFDENKPDVIIDCVDKFSVRAIINYFAVHNGIPLVSGGTNSKSGQVVVYEPGQSACIDCKLGVERALGMSLQGSKCTEQPDPSVIMTNEVIGGMMVGEVLKVLDKGYGAPVAKMLKYDSSAASRGGVLGSGEACDCTRGEITGWLSDLKEKYSSFSGGKSHE